MTPPPWVHGDRPRGPPPFVVQFLRVPLTVTNMVAFYITLNTSPLPNPANEFSITQVGHKKPCIGMFNINRNSAFSFLMMLFAASFVHNFMAAGRFHRIRRQVFGESVCAARRRWRREGHRVMDEEEKKALRAKFGEMLKRMPSAFISTLDVLLATMFFGGWIWSTMLIQNLDYMELGMAYASIGALVAGVFNLLIGVSGLKFYVRQQRKARREALNAHTETETLDVKERLIEA